MAAVRSGAASSDRGARGRRGARERGRPTIAMALFVRLMVLKQRTGWGYRTLVAEVSDSLHLRRFCGLSLSASVPHESTISKLARRLGPEVVDQHHARVDRQGAARAAVHGPRDALRLDRRRGRCPVAVGRRPGARWRARGWRARAPAWRPSSATAPARAGPLACCRSPVAADRPHDPPASPATGGALAKVLALTGQTGELVERSICEAHRAGRPGALEGAAVAAPGAKLGAARAPRGVGGPAPRGSASRSPAARWRADQGSDRLAR